MAAGESREPGVVDLGEGNRSEPALVKLVKGHHLDGPGNDLPVELLVHAAARELAGDDQDLQATLVDCASNLGQRAEVRALQGGGVELPVIRGDRRGDVEVAGMGARQLLAQPQGLGGRADHADLDARVAAQHPVPQPHDHQRLHRGDDERASLDGLVQKREANDGQSRADDGEAARGHRAGEREQPSPPRGADAEVTGHEVTDSDYEPSLDRDAGAGDQGRDQGARHLRNARDHPPNQRRKATETELKSHVAPPLPLPWICD